MIALTMSVRYGERVNIGDNIWVKVVRKTGGGVRLSIMAPPDVPIDRSDAPLLTSQPARPTLAPAT